MRPVVHEMFDRKIQIEYQLMPPNIHIRYEVERTIRTWKNNFVSGLSGTDNLLLLHPWERLPEKAQITLNMIRPSIRNPKISVHTILESNFDCNKKYLAPPGTKGIVHEKTNRRRTWGQNGVQVWYIGLAVDHYRCYKV